MLIKEVLIVEGKADVIAVKRAVEAECITTGGFHITARTLKNISAAYKKRGIIILTDPDSAGETIRNFLLKNDDVGVEQASPESIRKALSKVRTLEINPREEFTAVEMVTFNLSGGADSSKLRDKIGAALGIGYGNVKTFVRRLNNYGVTREEFLEALKNVTPVNR